MNKVVFNACYGGFSLSELAVKRMAELGCKWAKGSLEEIGLDDPALGSLTCRSFEFPLYDLENGTPSPARHDSILVQVVQKLGKKASGSCANLKIESIKGNKYKIDEYDGFESVETPEFQNWVVIEEKS